MRQIGSLPNRVQAARFAAFLITEDISCEADEEEDGQWSIWVHDEQQIPAAREHLDQFVADPENTRYQGREAAAEERVRQEHQRRLQAQRNTVEVRTSRQFQMGSSPPAPFIVSLIVLSIVVTLLTGFGKGGSPGSLKSGIVSHMQYVTSPAYNKARDPLANIKRGELWRLVTPIFPHLDFLHLLFNMFWLYQLGRLLEWRMGAPQLALFVAVVAVVANSAQAMTPLSMQEVMGGVYFFGMSGVVYGLFGYIWIKGQSDPTSGLALPNTMVFLMLGWMFLCMTPYQDAANTAHVGGLITGMVIAQFR